MNLIKKIFLGFWTFVSAIVVICSIADYQNIQFEMMLILVLFIIFPYWLVLKPKKKRKTKKNKADTKIKSDNKPLPIKESTPSRPVRTLRDIELAENFDMNHFEKCSDLEFNLLNLETDAKNERILHKKIQLLEKTIKAYDRLKKFCYSKGKGGTIYFQEEWESRPFLSDILKELEEAKQEKAMFMPNIIEAISENDGILQRNIYTIFSDEVNTSDIQAILKELEANGTITKIKKGNSYELHLNTGRNVMEQWNNTLNI